MDDFYEILHDFTGRRTSYTGAVAKLEPPNPGYLEKVAEAVGSETPTVATLESLGVSERISEENWGPTTLLGLHPEQRRWLRKTKSTMVDYLALMNDLENAREALTREITRMQILKLKASDLDQELMALGAEQGLDAAQTDAIAKAWEEYYLERKALRIIIDELKMKARRHYRIAREYGHGKASAPVLGLCDEYSPWASDFRAQVETEIEMMTAKYYNLQAKWCQVEIRALRREIAALDPEKQWAQLARLYSERNRYVKLVQDAVDKVGEAEALVARLDDAAREERSKIDAMLAANWEEFVESANRQRDLRDDWEQLFEKSSVEG